MSDIVYGIYCNVAVDKKKIENSFYLPVLVFLDKKMLGLKFGKGNWYLLISYFLKKYLKTCKCRVKNKPDNRYSASPDLRYPTSTDIRYPVLDLNDIWQKSVNKILTL
jgi:hypothetical protein